RQARGQPPHPIYPYAEGDPPPRCDRALGHLHGRARSAARVCGRRDEYARLVVDEMLPAVAGESLAEGYDVFCETRRRAAGSGSRRRADDSRGDQTWARRPSCPELRYGVMAAACPACCSPNANGSYRVPDHEYDVGHVADYTRCADCGTLFQQPMPAVNELATYYPARYHTFTAKGLIPALKHRSRLKRLASLVQAPRAVVLDYGCGDGGFIREAAARANGWSFWGFEIAD